MPVQPAEIKPHRAFVLRQELAEFQIDGDQPAQSAGIEQQIDF